MIDHPAYLHRLRFVLWLSIAVSFFFNLSAVPLFDVDEGAFSEATREMFERGDFISPYLNGAPRFDKPILIYWLQAGSVALFGFEPFAFRLPSALAATLWVLAVSAFVRKVRSPVLGYYAGIVTALCLAVSVIGKAATADALLNLFIAVSMFAVYQYYKARRTRDLLLGFAAMGLGFSPRGRLRCWFPVLSVCCSSHCAANGAPGSRRSRIRAAFCCSSLSRCRGTSCSTKKKARRLSKGSSSITT
jgi:4-amino-4-deoxy-L-arabinose transferase-like glycosyltransferase